MVPQVHVSGPGVPIASPYIVDAALPKQPSRDLPLNLNLEM